MRKQVTVADVKFDAVDFRGAISLIRELLNTQKQALVVTPNPEMLVAAAHNPQFKKVLNSANLAVADGTGVVLASRWLASKPLPERITGTDLLPEIMKISAEKKLKVFLLGAAPGVAEKAAKKFNPPRRTKLKIAGTFSGSPKKEDEKKLVSLINKSGAQVLAVAYGAPAQELWLARNLAKMPKIRLAIGVGGAFDFHAGLVRRAPKFMQKLGIEWLWRLLLEPRRLGRIWNATARFTWLVLSKNN